MKTLTFTRFLYPTFCFPVMLTFFSYLSGQTHNADIVYTMQETKYDNIILEFLDHLYRQKYKLAESILNRGLPRKEPGFFYFKGFLHCTIFNDYGDTSSLSLTRQYWEKLEKLLERYPKTADSTSKNSLPPDLYRGMTLMQLSYIASSRWHYLDAALKAKAGVKILQLQNQYLEAQCAIQIYEYYKNELMKKLNWLPFVDADNISSRKFLEKNYSRSHYLSVIFLTPLIWMQFDAGLYREGLQLARTFLKKYPENRIFRLMEADFYYKMGKYGQSAQIFEDVKAEYLKIYADFPEMKPIKINYLSAAGNLVRVYAAMGDKERQKKNAAIWFSDECKRIRKWLPKSLVKDLKRFKK